MAATLALNLAVGLWVCCLHAAVTETPNERPETMQIHQCTCLRAASFCCKVKHFVFLLVCVCYRLLFSKQLGQTRAGAWGRCRTPCFGKAENCGCLSSFLHDDLEQLPSMLWTWGRWRWCQECVQTTVDKISWHKNFNSWIVWVPPNSPTQFVTFVYIISVGFIFFWRRETTMPIQLVGIIGVLHCIIHLFKKETHNFKHLNMKQWMPVLREHMHPSSY